MERANVEDYISDKKSNNFEKRKSVEQIEESAELAPKFDQNGIIPVVTTDYDTGEVLMQAYMNAEAFKRTIKPVSYTHLTLPTNREV